jgi:hypothetical protein
VPLEIFDDVAWQMSLGERAAVEGVLAQLQPTLAVEIGTAQGACLRRIAAHAQEAHSFDLEPPSLALPDNVTVHTGDSHELLPEFLAELVRLDRRVDFVMVDGDHSAEGVRRDLEDLLESDAVAQAVILFHDVANERVRAGIEAVRFEQWAKVAHVELDWISGQLFAEPALRNELWGGLGLVVVDDATSHDRNGSVYEQRYHPAGRLLARVRDLVVADDEGGDPDADAEADAAAVTAERDAARSREAELQAELGTLSHRIDGAERALENIKGSLSWKLTGPLRAVKRTAAGRRAAPPK